MQRDLQFKRVSAPKCLDSQSEVDSPFAVRQALRTHVKFLRNGFFAYEKTYLLPQTLVSFENQVMTSAQHLA